MTRSGAGMGAQEQKVAEEAKRLGVRVEELAAAAVQDLLAQPDPAFQQAASKKGVLLKEDLHDLAIVAERRQEKRVPLDDLKLRGRK